MMYSRGPNTEPCGRPYGAGPHRDLVEPWTTLKVRSWRKESIHPRKLPDSPNVTFNRFRRILWSTMSKATYINVASQSNWTNLCDSRLQCKCLNIRKLHFLAKIRPM